MSVTQYIGARYVPIFAEPDQWTPDRAYEPLTIVMHEGASFTSKQAVPIGIEIDNTQFWACTGNYNAQVEAYRREVQQFASDIEANAEAIAAETAAREDAIAAETTARENAIAAETTARETSVQEISTTFETQINEINEPGWVTENRIAPEAVSYEALSPEVRRMHSTLSKVWGHIHINAVNGDDENGDGSENSPFKTLDKAFEMASEKGNNYSFYFQTPGTYTTSYSYFVGCVIHFRVWANCPSGHIHITREDLSDTRGFYLYDSHLYMYGTSNTKFIIDLPNIQFEEEGSVLWLNQVEFNVKNILLVQGSMHVAYGTFNCPIVAYFASLEIMYSYSNNQTAAHGLEATCCIVRFSSNTPFQMYRNANGASSYGLAFYSCRVSANSYLGLAPGVTNSNYQRYLYATASYIGIADEWIEAYHTYGNENSQITGISLRLAETTRVPAAQ